MEELHFKVNTGSVEELITHFREVDNNFVPPLSSRVNISDYSKKIVLNATRFEAWNRTLLVGLVALYMNDDKRDQAFITSISVLKEYASRGIASQLMRDGIIKAGEAGFKKVALDVSPDNIKAIALYEKLAFSVTGQSVDNMLTMTKFL